MPFIFNGTSSDEIGVRTKTITPPRAPKPRYEEVIIPGMDGSYKFFKGYEDLTVVVEILIDGNYLSRKDKVDAVKAWLVGSGELKLDYADAIEVTVIDVATYAFKNTYEMLQVTFKSGTATGTSSPISNRSFIEDLKERLTIDIVNDPKYLKSYIGVIDFGGTINLPRAWWHIMYLPRNDAGYGFQIAMSLDANVNQIYTRSSDGPYWSAWDRLIKASEFDALVTRVESLENAQ